MVSPVLTENRWSGEFLVSEANNTRSRDQVTLKQQTYSAGVYYTQAGTILGQYGPSTGAPVSAANGGNTGNGVMGAVTESAGAIVGVYTLEITTAAANAGEFDVYDPNGIHIGQGKVGVAFSKGGLSFTLADGATDFVIGDGFTITVAANADAGKYAPLNLSATDGTQNAAAILFNTVDASGGDIKVTVIARAAEVNGSELVYPAGITLTQQAAVAAQLAANALLGSPSHGIIIR